MILCNKECKEFSVVCPLALGCNCRLILQALGYCRKLNIFDQIDLESSRTANVYHFIFTDNVLFHIC